MFFDHVTKQLTAYCHGELEPGASRRVAEHLLKCPGCRQAYETAKLGIALAGELKPATLPDSAQMWRNIAAQLNGAPFQPVRSQSGSNAWGPRSLALVAAVLGLCVFAGVVFYARFHTPRIHLSVSTSALSNFQIMARDLHLDNLHGLLKLDFRSGSSVELRRWVARNTGLHAWVADNRPLEDAGRFALHGVKKLLVNGVEAYCLSFSLDGHRVTLLAAKEADMRQSPHARWFSKDITSHFDQTNQLKMLTWAKDGQVYAMVSDLPEFGQQGCFVCHTAPDRRELIRAMRPE